MQGKSKKVSEGGKENFVLRRGPEPLCGTAEQRMGAESEVGEGSID